MFQLAVIIPCYNEAKRITPTFEAYFKHLSEGHWKEKNIAIILVDDGSVDETADVIKSFEEKSSDNIKVISVSYSPNRGKGSAIKVGVSAVTAEVYGFVDADLAYEPALVDKAYLSLKNCDLLIGKRINDESLSLYGKLRNVISNSLKQFVNFIVAMPGYDTQSGFKFFKRNVAETIIPKVKQNRFSFDIEFILRALSANFKINELPISFSYTNQSTVTWKDGVRYILDSISISENLSRTNLKKLSLSLLAVAVVFSFGLYGWVIFKGFLFSDDFTWLWHGQKISSLYDVFTFRMSTFYSPVMNAFYAGIQSFAGYDPQIIFTINIFVHALVSFLAGILAWQLSKSRLIALVTTALTAVAGVAYEPLVWIGANMHSFVTLFILASLVSFYTYLERLKFKYLIYSLILYVVALGTKESAIVTPALALLLIIYKSSEVKQFLNIKFILFVITSGVISLLYLIRQYLWQKNSIWVESGVWNLSFVEIFRLPLILIDNLFPIILFKNHLTDWSAFAMWLFSVLVLAFVVHKFRHIKLVWLGLGWAVVSVAPFIFFQTQYWWEPLASRYNYLPRVGVILVLASILHYLIVNNKARRIISGLISLVVVSVLSQFVFMVYVVNTQYDYVYNTGRSLTSTMEEIAIIKPDKVLVRWDYPFTGNNAHIVGAASVIAGIKEEQIDFLDKGEAEQLQANEILLYWDAQSRKYSIRHN